MDVVERTRAGAEPRGMASGSGGRWRAWRWAGLGLLLAGLALAAQLLPLDGWMEDLRAWLEARGGYAYALFAGLYILAALLFIPGSALTIAAGGLFGLWVGVAVVSVASTTTAALAFLISRHLARRRVERWARQRPRFGAIDGAIAEGGWRVVALLRLSPVVPFSAGNYLFGLTQVAFVPYVLATWVAMLPGTFVYVYLGYVGALGLTDGELGAARWTLLGVGLVATIVVSVYVTRLARRKLQERAGLGAQGGEAADGARPARSGA